VGLLLLDQPEEMQAATGKRDRLILALLLNIGIRRGRWWG
jgi:hypothetical protein